MVAKFKKELTYVRIIVFVMIYHRFDSYNFMKNGVGCVLLRSDQDPFLTLSGPRFFRYRKDRKGGVYSTPLRFF